LWTGGYSQFERQRAEMITLQGKSAKKVEEKRKHLQAFVDRFRASATKASQAQSRLKMLARLAPVAAIIEDDVLPFRWPPVTRKLSPPIVTMEKVSAGYGERAVLNRIDLTLSNDDRIGLIGANGNGKSTFAKLIGGRLAPMSGKMGRANKLEVGFFAQHQVDDLDLTGTPYSHVADYMRGEKEAVIRARVAQIGFSGGRADTPIGQLSGGEKARLLMGLATFSGPQLLILDEPTNHLDIDSRAELIEAINDYEGACILISHDRRLLEACADRLWLVANGGVRAYEGDLADYSREVLAKSAPPPRAEKLTTAAKDEPKPRRDTGRLSKEINALEARMEKFQALLARIDEALATLSAVNGADPKAATLAAQRAELERALVAAEETWLALSAEAEE
jgi:ATP-binding cassette subfamily F protein 3